MMKTTITGHVWLVSSLPYGENDQVVMVLDTYEDAEKYAKTTGFPLDEIQRFNTETILEVE